MNKSSTKKANCNLMRSEFAYCALDCGQERNVIKDDTMKYFPAKKIFTATQFGFGLRK